MDAFVLLGSFLGLMIIGMPVAYALGLASLLGAWWIDIPIDAIMISIASGVNKFSLLAIPFFVLAGAIMAEGGMSRRLVAFAEVLVGFVQGGLSLVNILASTFFGAISGSSMADTASIGSVLIPEMEKKGYPRDFATAVTVSGSIQAILIPPSHNAVIYSLAAGGSVSIAALFLAGVLPGLLLGLTLAVMCLFIAKKRNFPKGRTIPMKEAIRICVDALWGLMTMVIILGGILSGIFTATESAAIAVIWAFFVTMCIYRDYKWRELPKLVHRTVKTLAIVMILIGFASSFGYIMTLMQIPQQITGLFTSVSNNKYAVLMMINILLLILGHIFMMCALSTRTKLIVLISASTSTLLHLLLPPLVRFTSPGFAVLFAPSAIVMCTTWVVLLLWPLVEMWWPTKAAKDAAVSDPE